MKEREKSHRRNSRFKVCLCVCAVKDWKEWPFDKTGGQIVVAIISLSWMSIRGVWDTVRMSIAADCVCMLSSPVVVAVQIWKCVSVLVFVFGVACLSLAPYCNRNGMTTALAPNMADARGQSSKLLSKWVTQWRGHYGHLQRKWERRGENGVSQSIDEW